MAKKTSWNPLAFAPTQVTLISSAIYIALFAVLLWSHFTIPSAPSDPTPVQGVNLTQAWLDLDVVGARLHPHGSRANDEVREYLIGRIEEILEGSGVGYSVVGEEGEETGALGKGKGGQEKDRGSKDPSWNEGHATLWKYDHANATFEESWRKQPWTIYTESSNIVVYIRGKQDGEWDWRSEKKYSGPGGVLVNAHYDSVSTGYGATDDGVGVITVLQLVSYFTTQGQQPEHGVVALLNNGEENGLYGAHAYLNHPIASFAHTFLNLEGAGAGGKATLFRSTDAEVTSFYARSPSPYGSIVSGDGFKQGFIRSGTDYSVFTEALGMRGLDVAFFGPRARYHTDQDAAREVSVDSLFHMLSASLETMKGLTRYDGDEFAGGITRRGKIDQGKGSVGVWFDLFGQAFAVMQLTTLFALSVTLLVVGPVLLIILEAILARNDKWYLLSRKKYLRSADDDEAVRINGIRGFFRFPIAFIAATAAVVALTFLQTKINPYIVYSHEYVVWAELITIWFAVSWFILAGGDRVRPTALQRMFCLIWLYVLSWIALVAATVGENNFKLGSGYFIVIYNAAVFVALLTSYLELFGLPTKQKYAEHVLGVTSTDNDSIRPGSRSSRTLLSQSRERPGALDGAREEDDATERTSLLRGNNSRSGGKTRQAEEEGLEESGDPFLSKAYGDEQAWSSSLLQWTWIIQFLILAPINIIIVGQIGLLVVAGIHQTPADGNSVLSIYLIMAVMTILLLLPLTPFVHRFTYQAPTLLFLVFAGCLVYNLIADPFTRDARMKFYFQQHLDLDTGVNNVTLRGLDGYIQDIISDLPSAAGRPLKCSQHDKDELVTCSWAGLAPKVIPEVVKGVAPYKNKTRSGPEPWLDFNATVTSSDTATFSLRGKETKQCKILFNQPVSAVSILGTLSSHESSRSTVGENGSSEVRLFSRDWDKVFRVNVTWESEHKAKGQSGKVVCLWSESEHGEIPALDEIKRFEPVWAAVTKAGDGLVEGSKEFELR
ncbi:hypothetical protein LTR78_009864 [Recurvomyces mirabilis]|uniref:Peptide hydrolase n=1 Tax=Recurvomyces mirabilis TaxID=574656 RepID=A0AAE0WGD6_9PEZI|nr:hypothetical protein LTR78_009864 [Recurvomyces mirabilis]KAK5150539.1 hypothetical protein LTS14_010033 [Recurvomyces mirabilis]